MLTLMHFVKVPKSKASALFTFLMNYSEINFQKNNKLPVSTFTNKNRVHTIIFFTVFLSLLKTLKVAPDFQHLNSN